MENSPNKAANLHWLNITEKVAVIGSISGSIVCILLQKTFYASLPISASLALNLLNRQRMLQLQENNQTDNPNLISEYQTYHHKLELLEKKVQVNHLELINKIEQANEANNNNLSKSQQKIQLIEQKIQELHQSLFELNKIERDLDTGLSDLNQQQLEMSKLVQELRIFSDSNHNISSNNNSADFHYNKGLIYQENKSFDQALESYNKAIEIDSNCAPAYHQRSIVFVEIGERRKALDDLRKASQIYFDNQDLERYNQIRNLTQKLHQTNITENTEENLVVNDLFS